MKKIIATALITLSLSSNALSPNEMFIVIGAVKYYNENCAGVNYAGMRKMNKGLKRFNMDKTPIYILEQNQLAVSSYKTAEKFGCDGTRNEAIKAGFGAYVN